MATGITSGLPQSEPMFARGRVLSQGISVVGNGAVSLARIGNQASIGCRCTPLNRGNNFMPALEINIEKINTEENAPVSYAPAKASKSLQLTNVAMKWVAPFPPAQLRFG